MSFFHASRIDPRLDSCSPAEPGFLLSLAPGQLDMRGMKIRAVKSRGMQRQTSPGRSAGCIPAGGIGAS